MCNISNSYFTFQKYEACAYFQHINTFIKLTIRNIISRRTGIWRPFLNIVFKIDQSNQSQPMQLLLICKIPILFVFYVQI